MTRVNLLSIETSNKIAAGEVVERPSSVVKELVENSLDAKSKNITVEIFDGGQKTIRITDDGVGIHPEDIEKAFMPHATSKIAFIEDIYNITTLGFRGEALPSIAAISNTILKSRTKEFDYGKEIAISGGKVDYMKEAGCNIGTIIEVNDLFFNVPARQKFLKSTQREGALISDIITRLALANSHCAFKLFNNDKKVLTTYGTNDIKDGIRALYGKEVYDNITMFERHSDIASVHGYIGNADISRGSRGRQSIFVNKRFIKSGLITAAVENAFKSFLTINKFPFFVVFIDIFPEFIDVNVHPTKSEIKFENERSIFKLVFDAVHEAIKESVRETFNISDIADNDFSGMSGGNEKNNSKFGEKFTEIDQKSMNLEFKESDFRAGYVKEKEVQLPIDLNAPHNYGALPSISDDKGLNDLNMDRKEPLQGANIAPLVDELIKPNTYDSIEAKVEGLNYDNNSVNSVNSNIIAVGESINTIPVERILPKFPSLNVIGQFNKTYILAQAFTDLYIVDQHAAHEKILFEKYRNGIKNADILSQLLLIPVVLELNPSDFSYYKENEEIFIKTGFSIEEFGENTVSIREVPLILGKPHVKELFNDILDNLKNMGSGETIEVKYDVIARLACKAAIKANDKLSDIEMNALLEDLRFIEEPFTCPHGRPTIIKVTLNELEKRFKRL